MEKGFPTAVADAIDALRRQLTVQGERQLTLLRMTQAGEAQLFTAQRLAMAACLEAARGPDPLAACERIRAYAISALDELAEQETREGREETLRAARETLETMLAAIERQAAAPD